jgi:signal transduction histidine kinase
MCPLSSQAASVDFVEVDGVPDSPTDSGLMQAPVTNTFAFLDRVTQPDISNWDKPSAPAAAWVAAHLVAAMVFISFVIAAGMQGGPGYVVVPSAWLIASSGLVAKVGWALLTNSSVKYQTPRVSPTVKLGLMTVLTEACRISLVPAGSAGQFGFAAVIAVMIGLRFAGLDAWDGIVRDPFVYVRSAVRPLRLLAALFGCLFFATTLVVLSRLVDPLLDYTWLREHGALTSRLDQFWLVVGAAVVLALPTLFLCEGISAVGRFHAAYDRQIAEHERKEQRVRLAGEIHDRALSTAEEIGRRSTEPRVRQLADELIQQLRRLQVERRELGAPRIVRDCLTEAAQKANSRGVDFRVDAPAEVLLLTVPGKGGDWLESFVNGHLANSLRHGANRADISLSTSDGFLNATYFDDAGGYSPALALGQRRGLAELESNVKKLGGEMRFREERGRTITTATLPVHASSAG